MADNDVVPTNGRHLPHGYSDDVVTRALALVQSTRSVADAQRILDRELELEGVEPRPDYHTMWVWSKQHDDVIESIDSGRKREMLSIASDVAHQYGARMMTAAPKLHDSQIPVAYGIAMQRRTDWDRVGDGANVQAIQINFTDSKGEKIDRF